MYLKVSVEGLVFGVDRLGCEVLGLDINAKVQCACMLNAISWCHIQAGYTSVQLAVEQKHEATVEVLLEAIVAAGMDIDARYESRRGGFGGFGAAATSTEQGQTLLMRASALGLTSTAAKLLALGADIAAKDAVLDNVCFSLFQFFFSLFPPLFLRDVFFWFVCICMYMYVCMYVYMIVYMFVLLYMYVCIHIYVR